MSSVTEIETAIHNLSVAEQRIIALHLADRLVDKEYPGGCGAVDEGIRFLPRYETCPALRESQGPKLRQRARTTR